MGGPPNAIGTVRRRARGGGRGSSEQQSRIADAHPKRPRCSRTLAPKAVDPASPDVLGMSAGNTSLSQVYVGDVVQFAAAVVVDLVVVLVVAGETSLEIVIVIVAVAALFAVIAVASVVIAVVVVMIVLAAVLVGVVAV